MQIKEIKGIGWLSVLVPAIIFVLHVFLFRNWIIDDAGISFVYARNLAKGYGLVSQPGVVPVEGYSNFFWVILLAPLFSLGIFHPIITPKLLSTLCVFASFVVLYRIVLSLPNSNKLLIFIILILIATNTPFTVWSTSGLENPLYTLLLCLLLFQSIQCIVFEKTSEYNMILTGVIVACIAVTRPEGILYFGISPLLLLTKQIDKQHNTYKKERVNHLCYSLSFGFLFISFLIFRIVYFKDIFPSAFYAKCISLYQIFNNIVTQTQIENIISKVSGQLMFLAFIVLITGIFYYALLKIKVIYCFNIRKQNRLALFALLTTMCISILGYFIVPFEIIIKILVKMQELMFSVADRFQYIVSAGLITITLYLVLTKCFKREHFVLFVFLVWSMCVYILLPPDWMGEYRFATPFIVFYYTYAVLIVDTFINGLKLEYWLKVLLITFMIITYMAGHIFIFAIRSFKFALRPPIPFTMVAQHYGHRFNQYATQLNIQKGSVLLPDAGGALYYSKLRVYDLSMLCDKTIMRTMGRDQKAFYDYVFEKTKPSFIHVHTVWVERAALDNDERFRRDYVPIYESIEDKSIYYADYVRKDVIEDSMGIFYKIQKGLKSTCKAKPIWYRR